MPRKKKEEIPPLNAPKKKTNRKKLTRTATPTISTEISIPIRVNAIKKKEAVPLVIRSQASFSPHVVDLKKNAAGHLSNLLTNIPTQTMTGHPVAHAARPSESILSFSKKTVRFNGTHIHASAELPPKSAFPFFQKKHTPSITPALSNSNKNEQKKDTEEAKELAALIAEDLSVRPISIRNTVISFALLSLLFLLPFHAIGAFSDLQKTKVAVVETTTTALTRLGEVGLSALQSDLASVQKKLSDTLSAFENARRPFVHIPRIARAGLSLVPTVGNALQQGDAIVLAGQQISLASVYLIKGIEAVAALSDSPLTEKIGVFQTHLLAALPRLESATAAVEGIPMQELPADRQASFQTARTLLEGITTDLQTISKLSETTPSLLGAEQQKRYLVIFQNNAELRATGGFIGSYALIDVFKGKITHMEIPGGGSYDLQGALSVSLRAPEPLHLVNSKWEFQDANWFPDFEVSAKKLEWFLEKSGGPSVDGVIAITTEVVRSLLTVTGPIPLPNYQLTLTEENFFEVLQTYVEHGYDKKLNRPKQLLADIAPELIRRVSETPLSKLLPILNVSLQKKNILLFSHDPTAQELLRELGWNGGIKQTPFDYLMIVHSNIAGEKTDLVTKNQVERTVTFEENGARVIDLTVHRIHEGIAGTPFTGVNNVEYVRMYVPKGSELLLAEGFTPPEESLFKVPENWFAMDADLQQQEKELGFEPKSGTRVTEESNKTVFGNWIITPPGETRTVHIRYRIPPPDEADTGFYSYGFFWQKQPGVSNTLFSERIHVPARWKKVWENTPFTSHGAYQEKLFSADEDTFLGIVFEPKS